MSDELTHLDERGRAHMVDVSAKTINARRAIAAGRVVTTPEVITLLRGGGLCLVVGRGPLVGGRRRSR